LVMSVLSHYLIDDVYLFAYDEFASQAGQWVAWEMQKDDYQIRDMHFDDGDVVIDIGAHIGLFSMYLAKRWPALKVFAFEPFPCNYRNCAMNLRINGIDNVVLSSRAIVNETRQLRMAADPSNSGGASVVVPEFRAHGVEGDIPSITLDEVFRVNAIDRCKLLKIDCEGMEYEILLGTRVLDKVEYLCGEFHSNADLEDLYCSPVQLYDYCREFFEEDQMKIQFRDIP
jgi:FkbM family methyltransferase